MIKIYFYPVMAANKLTVIIRYPERVSGNFLFDLYERAIDFFGKEFFLPVACCLVVFGGFLPFFRFWVLRSGQRGRDRDLAG